MLLNNKEIIKKEFQRNIKEIQKIHTNNKYLNENLKIKKDVIYELSHSNCVNYEQIQGFEEEAKTIQDKILKNNIKQGFLKNNIHYLLKLIFSKEVFPLLKPFENKNIGEKTKEKMTFLINDFFKNNYDIKTNCFIYKDSYWGYDLNFRLDLLNQEGYCDYKILNYSESFYIYFQKRRYNNFEIEIKFNRDIEQYIDIEEIPTKTTYILREYKKAKNFIEKQSNLLKQTKRNFDNLLTGFVASVEALGLPSDLRIY